MEEKNDDIILAHFQLGYNYNGYFLMLFLMYGIAYSFLLELNKFALTFVFIVILFILWNDLKSIASIKLTLLKFQLTYHPFYKPEIFEYKLLDIEEISIYYSWKRYHSTIQYIKLYGDDKERKHNTSMSVKKSIELVKVLRSLGVKVIELEWPK